MLTAVDEVIMSTSQAVAVDNLAQFIEFSRNSPTRVITARKSRFCFPC
jgi:hypothetical protein